MNSISKLYKKYETFIKYILVAGISFIIDASLFYIFNTICTIDIFIATIIARCISSFINYLLNRNKVFNSSESKIKSLIKYYILVIIQMIVSGSLVKLLAKVILVNPIFIKVPVEFILFVCNYLIQKIYIFKGRTNENNSKKL